MPLPRRAVVPDRALLAVAAVVLLLAAAAVLLVAGVVRSGDSGVRAGVAGLTGVDGGFRITLPLAVDGAAQDREVRVAIGSVPAGDGRDLDLAIGRDLESTDAVPLVAPDRIARSMLASIPDLRPAARLVDGRWPTSPGEATMQADAAATEGVAVGERLGLPDGSAIVISGTWRLDDPADPRWLGSSLLTGGSDDQGRSGFVVIDPSRWVSTGTNPLARWTAVPRSAGLTTGRLAALVAAPDVAADRVQAIAGAQDVDEDGRLQRALQPIETRLLAAQAVMLPPLLLVGLLGLLAVAELVRLREHGRRDATELLSARGRSRAGALLAAVPDAALLVVAAAAGAVTVDVLVPDAGLIAAVTVAATVAAASCAIVLIGAAGTGAPTAPPREAPRERAGSVAGVAVLALLVIGAIVTTAQLLIYGSPVVAGGATAPPRIDLLADAAPAVVVVALTLLVLAAYPLAGRAADRIGAARRGPSSVAARAVARRPRAALAPVVLLALGGATLTLAVAYAGTWEAAATATRTVQVGTDVRVSALRALPSTLGGMPSGRTGRTSAAPAAAGDAQIGDVLAPLVQLRAADVSRVVVPVAGAVDPAALARAIALPGGRPVIPADASRLTIGLDASPASAAPVQIAVIVSDEDGGVTTLYATAVAGGFAADVPAGGPWSVRAIDLRLGEADAGAIVRIAAVDADSPGGTTALTLSDWGPVAAPDGVAGLGPVAGVRAASAIPGANVRLMPRSVATARVPIAISRSVAAATGLRAGSQLDVGVVASGGSVPAVVRAVVPAIPGAEGDDGVLADLDAVHDAVIAADLHVPDESERWIRSPDPDRLAADLRRVAPAGADVVDRGPSPADAVLQAASLEVLAAAAIGALLAVVALAAALAAESGARRRDVAVLHALGLRPRRQGGVRAIEVGALLALGLLAGLVVGVVAAALVIPTLAATAVPDPLSAVPAVLRFEPVAAAGAAALLVLCAAAAVALSARAAVATARRRAAGALR